MRGIGIGIGIGLQNKYQSRYQGLSLRGQGRDFFLEAKDIKNFKGQLRQATITS